MNEYITNNNNSGGCRENPLALAHNLADFSSPSHRGVYVFHAPYPVEGGQSLLLLLTSLAEKRGCKERMAPAGRVPGIR